MKSILSEFTLMVDESLPAGTLLAICPADPEQFSRIVKLHGLSKDSPEILVKYLVDYCGAIVIKNISSERSRNE